MSVTTDNQERGMELERRYGSGFYASRGLTLVRGEGASVWDDQGNEYLDCTAMYGVASLGHGHPELAEAIYEQAKRMVACFSTFSNDVRGELMAKLVELASPMQRVFLCNSGTEAVEAAFKVARLQTGRTGIIATRGAFHGRTFGALSATFRPEYRAPYEPLVPGFQHVPYDDLTAMDEAITDQVAAVIVEPVQGEGGVRVPNAYYLRDLAALCHNRGALLILDEVQTGFGRIGDWFGMHASSVEPDLVCVAKGIAGGFPMGALLIGERVDAIKPQIHGTTFGGNPLACAAARATLTIMERDRIPQEVARKGEAFIERLKQVESPRIREVRGQGLLVGIELKERSAPYQKALQERGILALGAGPTVLRFLPPLIIRDDELDRVADEVASVLAE